MRLKTLLIALPILFSFAAISAFKTTGGNPSANGGGTTVEAGAKSTFTFNAVQHSDGSVNGHLQYNVRGIDVTIHMDINCLTISGNRATLGGTVTSISGTPIGISVGDKGSFSVEDNGQGSNATGPDKISDVFFYPGASCADNGFTYLPISGNITVKQ